MYGFYKVGVASLQTQVANPQYNTAQILTTLQQAHAQELGLLVFPELCITAYSCGDLFLQQTLLENAKISLESLLEVTSTIDTIFIVGLPLLHQNRLYNCAVVCQKGTVLGVVPKTYIPNHKEFYEKRWFSSGKHIRSQTLTLDAQEVPFGSDLLFKVDENCIFGVELCEDLWAMEPPSSKMCASGATMIANLSSSNEVVSKASYRRSLVSSQSARTMGAYLYASSGVGESTTDLVFSGDCMIAENGAILEQNERFSRQNTLATAFVDLSKLKNMRLHESSYSDFDIYEYQTIATFDIPMISHFGRTIDAHPFVPHKGHDRDERVSEIISIQKAALAKRLQTIGCKKVVLGISGGLDSTLALLVVHECFKDLGYDVSEIECITMPGFGTTSTTKTNAHRLCQNLGIKLKQIDITAIAKAHFEAIEHDASDHSVVYENVQARLRTQLLMDRANKIGGIVIGTGDLSEIALGWSTYNGDHMSMYAINCSIPKTLIRYIIEHFAQDGLEEVLHAILHTPVSPELLPHDSDKISQETEKIIGPYELHDFFLYHFMKYGASPQKILFLATQAFKEYETAEIKKWLQLFIKRFFTQQFKRSAMPDGPKVGTISLSPRGDWKMPSDGDMKSWYEDIS
ncbi:MAG: NAD(+) synthase [Campylobacterota bacterium]